MKKCPRCKALVDSLMQANEYHNRECRACRRGVWQTANDVICRTPEEFAYWIKLFREAGREGRRRDPRSPTTHSRIGNKTNRKPRE